MLIRKKRLYFHFVKGQEILTQSWSIQDGYNSTTLDLSDLAVGSYQVTVRSANDYYTKRLMVTK